MEKPLLGKRDHAKTQDQASDHESEGSIEHNNLKRQKSDENTPTKLS